MTIRNAADWDRYANNPALTLTGTGLPRGTAYSMRARMLRYGRQAWVTRDMRDGWAGTYSVWTLRQGYQFHP